MVAAHPGPGLQVEALRFEHFRKGDCLRGQEKRLSRVDQRRSLSGRGVRWV